MDKSNKALFREDLIFLDVDLKDTEQVFDFIYNKLFERGIVKESFLNGIKERESKYPTGLPTKPYCVAIPHCNPENVNTESVSIIRFNDTVRFGEMGKIDQYLDCKFAFVLTMKGVKQVSILSDLINVFQSESTMDKILKLDEKAIFDFIQEL